MSNTSADVVLIDNYDSFTYNLYQMLQAVTQRTVRVFRNDAIDLAGLVSLQPDRIVLSPGPGHPSVPTDVGVCRDVILETTALSCPVLGVCLGHQAMVHYLGGQVTQAPEIVHGKTSDVRIDQEDPLLEGLSNPFSAMRYHSLVADEDSFPAELTITARESKNGLVMALRHKSRPLYGVQFHPESIGTPEGHKLLENFLTRC